MEHPNILQISQLQSAVIFDTKLLPKDRASFQTKCGDRHPVCYSFFTILLLIFRKVHDRSKSVGYILLFTEFTNDFFSRTNMPVKTQLAWSKLLQTYLQFD